MRSVSEPSSTPSTQTPSLAASLAPHGRRLWRISPETQSGRAHTPTSATSEGTNMRDWWGVIIEDWLIRLGYSTPPPICWCA